MLETLQASQNKCKRPCYHWQAVCKESCIGYNTKNAVQYCTSAVSRLAVDLVTAWSKPIQQPFTTVVTVNEMQ